MMLIESIFKLSATLKVFCRKLEETGLVKGNWALLHRDNSTIKMDNDIRPNQLNSSVFYSKS